MKQNFLHIHLENINHSFKKIVKDLGFNMHLVNILVLDKTKDKFELPRFPINEKYGKEKRFKIW